MNRQTFSVVIRGAGIAAHALTVRCVGDVVDERPPLSLTSDTSTECYRTSGPAVATRWSA